MPPPHQGGGGRVAAAAQLPPMGLASDVSKATPTAGADPGARPIEPNNIAPWSRRREPRTAPHLRQRLDQFHLHRQAAGKRVFGADGFPCLGADVLESLGMVEAFLDALHQRFTIEKVDEEA